MSSPGAARGTLLLLHLLFLVSGMCGLVHEVAWTRLLRRVIGNTTDSITIVLCVFMGGLALGAYLFGRVLLRSKPPLLVFAGLEAIVGLWCFLLPQTIGFGAPLYGSLYSDSTADFSFVLARLAFAVAVLGLPAVLMGGTLPVLTRFIASTAATPGIGSGDGEGGLGRKAGTLYAINTLGAVAGASLGAFFFVPSFGVSGAIRVAATLNLLIAVFGVLLHRKSMKDASAGALTSAPPVAAGAPNPAGHARTVVLLGYAVSGAAALIYEIGWTRALSLLVGSSVYAFGLMLTSFVLGLALGSLVASRIADRVARPLVWLAGIQAGIALAGLVVVPLLAALPLHVTGWLVSARESFWQVQAVTFGLFLLVMLAPTLLMGAMFPFASRLVGVGADADRAVGTVYASNTLGSIIGAAIAGFVLVPWVGVRGALLAAVLLNLLVAAAFAESSGVAPKRRRVFVGGGLVVGLGLVFLMPSWDPARTGIGSFAFARRLPARIASSPEALAHEIAKGRIIFLEDGRNTTVTVIERPSGELILSVNGKPDASSVEDLSTQLLLAHVPMLLHEDPNDVLVIGLASGITLAAAGKHDAEALECAEIAPSVVRACRRFELANDRILDDPRTRILTADGRNHLALTDRSYDVIISEPSNPWIAGIGDLFTREFFEICHDRLRDGGVACIWVESYNIDQASMRSIVRTFLDVFPNGSLWNIGPYDFELIGVKGELSVDATRLAARAVEGRVGDDLARIGVASVPDLLAKQVAGPDSLREFAGDAEFHTDDNALLEFRAPRILISNRGEIGLVEAIEAARAPTFDWLSGAGAEALRAESMAAAESASLRRRAEIHVLKAQRARLNDGAEALRNALAEMRRAAELDPENEDVVASLEEGLRQAGTYEQQGLTAEAIATYRGLLSVFPTHHRPTNDLAWLLATHPNERFRDGTDAIRLAELAVTATDGRNSNALDTLAAAYAEAGRFKEARVTISKALSAARRANEADILPSLEDHEATIRRGEPIRVGGG